MKNSKVVIVFPMAGISSRMGSLCEERPKSLLPDPFYYEDKKFSPSITILRNTTSSLVTAFYESLTGPEDTTDLHILVGENFNYYEDESETVRMRVVSEVFEGLDNAIVPSGVPARNVSVELVEVGDTGGSLSTVMRAIADSEDYSSDDTDVRYVICNYDASIPTHAFYLPTSSSEECLAFYYPRTDTVNIDDHHSYASEWKVQGRSIVPPGTELVGSADGLIAEVGILGGECLHPLVEAYLEIDDASSPSHWESIYFISPTSPVPVRTDSSGDYRYWEVDSEDDYNRVLNDTLSRESGSDNEE